MLARILAVAMVLMLGAGPAMADYFQVSVDINNINPFPPPKGNVPPGAGQAGAFGQPGGGFGGQPAFGGKKGKGGKGFVPPPAPVAPGNFVPPSGTAPIVQHEPLWVTIYLDIRGEIKSAPNDNRAAILDHQFGKSAVIPVLDPAHLELKLLKKEPLANSIRKLRGTKDKKDKKNLVQAAAKAWSYGLMKEFHESIKELKDIDAKNPVVIAYQQIQNQLKAAAPPDDPALKGFIDEAKSEGFQAMVISDKGHYGLLSNMPPLPANDALVKRRLARLEEEFESFYYWFALQENVPIPPPPQYRLLGIVVNDSADFYRRNKNWGSMPMLGDGFTPRRENVMILASKRLDEAYSVLANKNREWQQAPWLQPYQIAPDDFLHGTVWNQIRDPSKLLSVAYLQTLAIVQRAMEDEAERTTLSHEAIRQLLAATGLLPRNVVAPEWILEGLAAYFERPFGAVYGNGGMPSWSNLVSFKFHNLSPRTLGKGRDILLDTISDRYFHIARLASFDLDEPRDKYPENVRDDWERARATSWALVYYLARDKKMDRLFRYAKEVGQMPRDLELNSQALGGSFAKAFDLSDAKDALKMDPDRLQVFADSWLEFMKTLNLELAEVETRGLEYRVDMATPIPQKTGPAPKGKGPPLPPPR